MAATTTVQKTITVLTVDLYSNGQIVNFDNGEGVLIRTIADYPPQDGDRYRIIMEGDTLLGLAYAFYTARIKNAQYLWHVIADANLIFDPFDLSDWVGKSIRIPNIDGIVFNV